VRCGLREDHQEPRADLPEEVHQPFGTAGIGPEHARRSDEGDGVSDRERLGGLGSQQRHAVARPQTASGEGVPIPVDHRGELATADPASGVADDDALRVGAEPFEHAVDPRSGRWRPRRTWFSRHHSRAQW
jgi:hypothetical protein